MWEQLVTLLTETLELYQVILALSQRKRDVLVSGKAKDLETLTKQEEVLILQIGKLEGRREAVVRDLAASYNIEPENFTLEKIKELAEPELAKRLAELGAGLEQVAKELVPLNKLNTELIQQALTFIDYNMNLLSQNTVGPIYASGGQAAQDIKSKTMIDTKA